MSEKPVIERIAKPSRVRDLTGQQFNSWTVIGYYGRKRYPNGTSFAQLWECRCECGEVRNIEQRSLTTGISSQCTVCGHGEPGGCFNPLYSTWLGMKNRCSNPNHADYQYYGARGIKVCPRWQKSFTAFSIDLVEIGEKGEGMTLDRINTDGDYEPGNVRWATHSEQMSNRRPYKIKTG